MGPTPVCAVRCRVMQTAELADCCRSQLPYNGALHPRHRPSPPLQTWRVKCGSRRQHGRSQAIAAAASCKACSVPPKDKTTRGVQCHVKSHAGDHTLAGLDQCCMYNRAPIHSMRVEGHRGPEATQPVRCGPCACTACNLACACTTAGTYTSHSLHPSLGSLQCNGLVFEPLCSALLGSGWPQVPRVLPRVLPPLPPLAQAALYPVC